MRSLIGTLLAVPMLISPTAALAKSCKAAVFEELERLGITRDDITEARLYPVVQPNVGGGRLIGWEAWIERKSCDGQIVINLRTSCNVRDTYGRGDCKVD
ncbi:MAG: hypothetical protein QNJ92_16365 [Alphaproteobacteria bacterium]|nr:hypothetical protein [Alphaproteobacteria bacterium]